MASQSRPRQSPLSASGDDRRQPGRGYDGTGELLEFAQVFFFLELLARDTRRGAEASP